MKVCPQASGQVKVHRRWACGLRSGTGACRLGMCCIWKQPEQSPDRKGYMIRGTFGRAELSAQDSGQLGDLLIEEILNFRPCPGINGNNYAIFSNFTGHSMFQVNAAGLD